MSKYGLNEFDFVIANVEDLISLTSKIGENAPWISGFLCILSYLTGDFKL